MIMKPKILLLLEDLEKMLAAANTSIFFLMHSNDIDMGMLLPVHP